MFGRRKYQAIFRSRWRALIWASGILMTAYCVVPREDGSDPFLDAAAGSVAEMQERQQERDAPRHVNPWALPPEQQQH